MRKLALYLVAGAFLLLSPVAVLSSYSYSVPQIQRALAGTWRATITREGHTQTFAFRIEVAHSEPHASRGWIAPAAACGKRTLIASADACIDVTSVPLVLVALDGNTQMMTGDLAILGKDFRTGDVALSFGDAELFARISHTGAVSDVRPNGDFTVGLVHDR